VKLAILLTSGALALLAGCGGDEETGTTAGGGATEGAATSVTATGPAVQRAEVQIASFKFLPPVIKVRTGGTVVFTNQDKAPHTATDRRDERAFNTDTLKTGETGELRFEEPGTYHYFCVFHPFMEGDIVVEEGA
jgi:plastocyanin